MHTLLLPADKSDTAAIAAKILKEGGLVAIPTETVYGLGADGLNSDAVAKIFLAKGRPHSSASSICCRRIRAVPARIF